MAANPSNETLLEQLRHGLAEFEFISPPLLSISNSTPFFRNTAHRFFARIGPPLGGGRGVFWCCSVVSDSRRWFLVVTGGEQVSGKDNRRGGSPAMKKLEHYSVQKVTVSWPFLILMMVNMCDVTDVISSVKGMSLNKGITLDPREERENADELRMAVKEVICDNENERFKYEEALIAITVDESLKRYCQRIGRPDFWGGESELLVLSKLCCQPITVYIPEHEHARGGSGSGFIPIAEYGTEFSKGSRKVKKPRQVVRLLYSGKNHYDLLV
ncbi:hypothetical protein RHMOL_Rhmol05G0286800 [Rhododendron molle]|uniref:Uncharacterized protein n=1 Tax=Rhododendron molle TaxID=49168 RepID=A0ACC0NUF3_RHOML|nr:hypothetical protein RHMOL_Rhmol05G0286800 [Rhododendron molle]